MKCKLCGGKSHRYVKIKNGSICEECYNKMPMLIAINCGSLTSSEITSAYRIMKEITDEEIKKICWCSIGTEYSAVELSDEKLVVQNAAINYEDIKDISFSVIPKRNVKDSEIGSKKHCAKVDIYVTLETKKPCFRINTLVKKNTCLDYIIHGKQITFDLPVIYTKIINALKQVIDGKEKDFSFFHKEFTEYIADIKRKKKEEEEEVERKWEEYLNQKHEKEREEKRQRDQKDYYRFYNSSKGERFNKDKKQNNQKNNKSNSKSGKFNQKNAKVSEFEKAKKMFGVEIPYTEAEIRKKRNELIKKVHPDAGGSEKKAAQINEYYALLKKFVVS
jgi:hypothetical protein